MTDQQWHSKSFNISLLCGLTLGGLLLHVGEARSLPVESETSEPLAQTVPSEDVLDQLNRYGREGRGTPRDAGQVTSVSQLRDVQPTDWAFQALQSLVERYGCIAGYPDGTFRGNRPMTRYEFAAGLNACLDRITELIDGDGGLSEGELTTIRRLQEEFQAELTTLRGRVDALEARTAELEANQFSTTTKLTGEVIFAATDAFSDDDSTQTVLQQRVRLNFNTSFTGEDLLITRLQAGNGTPLDFEDGDDFPFVPTSEAFPTHQVFGDTGNEFVLDTLEYFFPVGDNLTVAIAANAGIFDDFIPTVNPYLEDFDGGSGSISAFGQRNPIYRLGGGAGLGLNFQLGDAINISGGYLASEGASTFEGDGLFDGDYAAMGQVTFDLGNFFTLGLSYNHAYFGTGRFGFDNGGGGFVDSSTLAFTGTGVANTLAGLSALTPTITNSYGAEVSFQFSSNFILGGWASLTDAQLIGLGDANIWTYAATLALPDLGGEGNLAGLVVGVEPTLRGLEVGDDFVNFGSRDPAWHVEGFYKFQLNDNISVTPGAIWLLAPNQSEDNDDVVIGTLRTTFTF